MKYKNFNLFIFQAELICLFLRSISSFECEALNSLPFKVQPFAEKLVESISISFQIRWGQDIREDNLK